MTRKRHRRTPLYVALLTAAILLALMLTQRGWRPYFFKRPLLTTQNVAPMLPAPSMREGAQEAVMNEKSTVLRQFMFDKGQDSLNDWEEKVFKGQTAFRVEKEGGLCYLSSKSQDACTGLFIKMQEQVTPDLWISWKWRAHEFPQKKHPELLSNRSEDDFSARVYAIFVASSFFKSDVIEYIWDEKLPVGTFADSPYSERVKLFVVRSGPMGGESGGWAKEQRNLYEDYQNLFGKAPRNPVGLVALMSDSDNTKTQASADFAEIILKRKQPQRAA